MPSYARRLFRSYTETHADRLEGDLSARLDWFRRYARRHYLPHLASMKPREGRLLEIGCGKGLLLQTFRELGFQRLAGVDLSPQDVEVAVSRVPDAEVVCSDALPFLQARPATFDAVILKAVLEHVPKDEVLPLLQAISAACRPTGVVLIDVPNMDWLFATHERYMDFTHECGYTAQSLGQVLRQVFDRVDVTPLEHIEHFSLFDRLKARCSRWILNTLLRWADAQGAANPIWSRSILGIARAPRICRGSRDAR